MSRAFSGVNSLRYWESMTAEDPDVTALFKMVREQNTDKPNQYMLMVGIITCDRKLCHETIVLRDEDGIVYYLDDSTPYHRTQQDSKDLATERHNRNNAAPVPDNWITVMIGQNKAVLCSPRCGRLVMEALEQNRRQAVPYRLRHGV